MRCAWGCRRIAPGATLWAVDEAAAGVVSGAFRGSLTPPMTPGTA